MLAGFDGNDRLGAGQLPPWSSLVYVQRTRAACGEHRQYATQRSACEPPAAGALRNQDDRTSW